MLRTAVDGGFSSDGKDFHRSVFRSTGNHITIPRGKSKFGHVSFVKLELLQAALILRPFPPVCDTHSAVLTTSCNFVLIRRRPSQRGTHADMTWNGASSLHYFQDWRLAEVSWCPTDEYIRPWKK
jgi:hypothetical protein